MNGAVGRINFLITRLICLLALGMYISVSDASGQQAVELSFSASFCYHLSCYLLQTLSLFYFCVTESVYCDKSHYHGIQYQLVSCFVMNHRCDRCHFCATCMIVVYFTIMFSHIISLDFILNNCQVICDIRRIYFIYQLQGNISYC